MNTMTRKLLGVTALRVREPATDVADLGEQAGRAHGPASGQGLEDVGVGVQDQLTDRRFRPVTAMALSLIDGHRAPGSRCALQNASWTSTGRASGAVAQRHLGCIGSRSATTDRKRVPQ